MKSVYEFWLKLTNLNFCFRIQKRGKKFSKKFEKKNQSLRKVIQNSSGKMLWFWRGGATNYVFHVWLKISPMLIFVTNQTFKDCIANRSNVTQQNTNEINYRTLLKRVGSHLWFTLALDSSTLGDELIVFLLSTFLWRTLDEYKYSVELPLN